MADKRPLTEALLKALDFVHSRGYDVEDAQIQLERAMKTEAYYRRALNRDVLDFYRGDIESGEFIDDMVMLISEQLTRAWNEGMRENGLDPKKDMTDEWQGILDGLIADEEDHVLDYAQAIEDARNNGTPIDPLKARVELWVNRYPEVVSFSKITTAPKDRFVWRLGATEQHCDTCARLNGTVATGADWIASGFHPQDPPNDLLECGGWRCDCKLEYTEEPTTEGGIPGAKSLKFDPDQPRDDAGRWTDSGGGGGGGSGGGGGGDSGGREKINEDWSQLNNKDGPTLVYHGTGPDYAENIKNEGLKRGKEWAGRAPSVYFSTSEKSAHEYAQLFGALGPEYSVVEFEIPKSFDPSVIFDDADFNAFGINTSFRIEKDIPVDWIKSIKIINTDFGTTEELIKSLAKQIKVNRGYVPIIIIG
jgi:hypothetical protein